MRNKDDRNEFKEQQDAEIMDAYRRIFKLYGGHVGVRTLYEMVSFAPASRFFVSARQAYRVISRMLCGAPMPKMRPTNHSPLSSPIPPSPLSGRPSPRWFANQPPRCTSAYAKCHI